MGVYRSNIVVFSIKIGPIGSRIPPQVINIVSFADFFPNRQLIESLRRKMTAFNEALVVSIIIPILTNPVFTPTLQKSEHFRAAAARVKP